MKDFFSKCKEIGNLVIFIEEIIDEKVHFLCSDHIKKSNLSITYGHASQ